MKIVVVDDNATEQKRTLSLVLEYFGEHKIVHSGLMSFASALDLLTYLETHPGFDLYLLDIYMPGINGIELAREIRKKDQGCMIVFITSSCDFALASYEVEALQYILKPFEKEKLFQVMDRCMRMKEQKSHEILLKTDNGYRKIQTEQILFVEAAHHFQNFYLEKEVVSTRMNCAQVEQLLAQEPQFARCHQSYLVNLDKIEWIEKNVIHMLNGDSLEISRRTGPSFKKRYLSYMSERTEHR